MIFGEKTHYSLSSYYNILGKILCIKSRGAKERLFLRELLQPLIKKLLRNDSLELELDSMVVRSILNFTIKIYKSLIKQEETQTGQRSSRPYDRTPSFVASDPDVKKTQLESKFTNILKK